MEYVNLKTGTYADVALWNGQDVSNVQTVLNKNFLYYYDYPKYDKHYQLSLNANKSLYIQVNQDETAYNHHQDINIPPFSYVVIDDDKVKRLDKKSLNQNYKRPHVIYGRVVNKKTNYGYNYNIWTGNLNCLPERHLITNAGGLFGTPFHFHVNKKHQLCLDSTFDNHKAKINVGDYILKKYPINLSIFSGFVALSPKHIKKVYKIKSRHIRTIGLNEHKTYAYKHILTPEEHRENKVTARFRHDTKFQEHVLNTLLNFSHEAMYTSNDNKAKLRDIMYHAYHYVLKTLPFFDWRFLEHASGHLWSGNIAEDKENIYKDINQYRIVYTCEDIALCACDGQTLSRTNHLVDNVINRTFNYTKGLNGSVLPIKNKVNN